MSIVEADHTLGVRIHELRKAAGLTQMELASRARVSQSYLSRLERGVLVNPASQVVSRLARALGVPVPFLYAPAGGESLVLRAELHARVTRAVDAAGPDLDRGADDARRSLRAFVSDLPPGMAGVRDLADWGEQLVTSHVALKQMELEESRGQRRPRPRGGVRPALPEELQGFAVPNPGLVPGADEGDLLLYSPTQPPTDGDLAIVEIDGAPQAWRLYFLPGGQVQLVHPAGMERPRMTQRSAMRVVGRVLGLLYGPPKGPESN